MNIKNLKELPKLVWALLIKSLLCQFALLPDGVQRAKKYARDCVEASWGLDRGKWEAGLELAKDNIERLKRELANILSDKETLPAAANMGSDPSMPIMSRGTIAMQTLRAVIIIMMLVLGVNNCAALLIKSGEPFLTNEWLAYVTASGVVPVLVFCLKTLIAIPQDKKTQLNIAYGVTVSSLLSTLLFLIILSHQFTPDYQGGGDFDLGALLGESGITGEEIEGQIQPNFFRDTMAPWTLFLQLLGEACAAAGVSYLFSRTWHEHRSARIRRSPEWRELDKKEKEIREELKVEYAKVGEFNDNINFLSKAQDVAEEQAATFVQAQQKRDRDLGMG